MNKLLLSIVAAAALAGFCLGAQAQNGVASVEANAEAGAKKAAMCIGCHSIEGYQASFPEIHKVPKIAGQGAKYIASALSAYRKGDRKHPTMRSIAASLTDQDINDLAAYYEKQGQAAPVARAAEPAKPSDQVAKLLDQGKCVTCHGTNFTKPIDGTYPKLAGQYGDYLFVALKSYQTTNNPQVGRANPVMAANIQGMSNAQLKALAEYLSKLDGELHTVPQSRFR